MKKLIGLTGRTGSGKSSVAKIFEELGVFCVDCDKVAHEVLFDNDVKVALVDAFSDAILDKDGNIARKELGEIVFADSEKLRVLNGIVHGAILKRCFALCENSGSDICLIDGSELESSGADTKCDIMLVTVSDEDVRLKRIMARDGIDKETALRRMRSQKDYSKDAVIIENNANEEELRKKILSVYESVIK
ncbi:MAG: dephospho-CoA kinase [Clostridia bacterium]|nr:dephospho-CoA kinase [Clostridia bacterium]